MRVFWHDANSVRYEVASAINSLEKDAKEEVLDIPQCHRFYIGLKKGLFGVFDTRVIGNFHGKVLRFEECMKINYPDIYQKYTNNRKVASLNYQDLILGKDYKQQVALTREQLNEIYDRAAKRLEKQSGGKIKPENSMKYKITNIPNRRDTRIFN